MLEVLPSWFPKAETVIGNILHQDPSFVFYTPAAAIHEGVGSTDETPPPSDSFMDKNSDELVDDSRSSPGNANHSEDSPMLKSKSKVDNPHQSRDRVDSLSHVANEKEDDADRNGTIELNMLPKAMQIRYYWHLVILEDCGVIKSSLEEAYPNWQENIRYILFQDDKEKLAQARENLRVENDFLSKVISALQTTYRKVELEFRMAANAKLRHLYQGNRNKKAPPAGQVPDSFKETPINVADPITVAETNTSAGDDIFDMELDDEALEEISLMELAALHQKQTKISAKEPPTPAESIRAFFGDNFDDDEYGHQSIGLESDTLAGVAGPNQTTHSEVCEPPTPAQSLLSLFGSSQWDENPGVDPRTTAVTDSATDSTTKGEVARAEVPTTNQEDSMEVNHSQLPSFLSQLIDLECCATRSRNEEVALSQQLLGEDSAKAPSVKIKCPRLKTKTKVGKGTVYQWSQRNDGVAAAVFKGSFFPGGEPEELYKSPTDDDGNVKGKSPK